MNSKPLSGKRVLITRAAHQSESSVEKFTAVGAEVTCLPLIEITPPDSWAELDNAIAQIDHYNWVVFASSNAVGFFMQRLNAFHRHLDDSGKTKIATIGPSTTATLESYKLSPDYQSDEFVAEAFIETFPGYPNLKDVRFLWPKTNIGRTYIADKLREAGAIVDIVAAYKTTLPGEASVIGTQLLELLAPNNRKIDIITLASAQTAKHMAAVMESCVSRSEFKRYFQDITIAAIGPETARAALSSLGKCDVVAKTYTVDGLIAALCDYGR